MSKTMKLVDLKRLLVPGRKLRLVLSPAGKCSKDRVVKEVDNKGAHLTGDDITSSLLPWPLARELRATRKGFEILSSSGKAELRYEWVDKPVKPSAVHIGNPKITHVAIRFQGVIYSLPAPNRHHDIIRHIVETVAGVSKVDSRNEDQGFLDESGRYLTRRQALHSAKINNQLKPDTMGPKLGQLYSEDIW